MNNVTFIVYFIEFNPQEYIDYYGTAGVQHIALRSEDIITSVRKRFNQEKGILKNDDIILIP